MSPIVHVQAKTTVSPSINAQDDSDQTGRFPSFRTITDKIILVRVRG